MLQGDAASCNTTYIFEKEKEIVGGTGNGKLTPQGTATRGQIVTVLLKRKIPGPHPRGFFVGAWYNVLFMCSLYHK